MPRPWDLLWLPPPFGVHARNGALYRWPFDKSGEAVQIDVQGPITLDEATLSGSQF